MNTETSPALKRALSLPLMIFFGLGNILGAGIYVLIGKVAGHAGMFTPFSFLIASLAAVFTAFSYAELSSRHPHSAGAAVYVDEGFNIMPLSLFTGLLLIFTAVVSSATIMRGSVGYMHYFIDLPGGVLVFIMLTILGAIAAWGVRESATVIAIISAVEICGLIIVIFVARSNYGEIPVRLPELIPEFEWQAFSGIFAGAFLAFYAFLGFEDMVNMAEEMHEPTRNLPFSILASLVIATLLYIIVALAAIFTLAPDQLAQADAPLGTIYKQATGSEPVLLGIISVIAVINGALIQIIMAARVCYGMSRRKWLPGLLGKVHRRTQTPVIATIIITLLVLVMALWLPIETLARATNSALLIIFVLVNLALLKIKHKRPSGKNIFAIPMWVPVAGFLVSAVFLFFQFAG